MTDILTTDKSIAAGARVAQPSRRANRILAFAIAATVAFGAGFVALNPTSNDSPLTTDRAAEATQLRWEGLAAAQTVNPGALVATQLRWEGLAENITTNASARQTATQLRWEGLAENITAGASASQAASQQRWEGLATRSATGGDRSLDAQVARWKALAAAHAPR